MIRPGSVLMASPGLALLLGLCGCNPSAVEAPPPPATGGYYREAPSRNQAPAPAPSREAEATRDLIPKDRLEHPRYSWETAADERFAEFLKTRSGGMIRQAAVGLEKSGKLRVQVDSAVAPDDTLPLTKSILAGARKDFAGKAFTLSVYDPAGEPILRAHVDPDRGVRYQVVEQGVKSAPATPSAAKPTGAGASDRDRKFAEWAERSGKDYLRYLEADLEKNGRLWFGVTKEVKPADVPELTKSILEGARAEFPRREIVATVFDPDGEKIGRARLGGDGRIRWER